MHIARIVIAVVDDHLHGTLCDFAERLVHAGQRRHELISGENVVKPHYGQLFGQRNLMFTCRAIRAYRRQVVAAENRGGSVGEFQQPAGCFIACFGGKVVALFDIGLRQIHPGLLQSDGESAIARDAGL